MKFCAGVDGRPEYSTIPIIPREYQATEQRVSERRISFAELVFIVGLTGPIPPRIIEASRR